jgi:DNA-binding transcriptional ArsR family regulator
MEVIIMSFKLTGQSKWLNQETGEVREILNAEIDTSKKGRADSFVIAILPYIIRLTDIAGNKKMKVVNYVLENMALSGKYSNILIMTQRELAKKAGVSIQTVSVTLELLEEAEIIKKGIGRIMLHPKVIMKGSAKKERALMVKFSDFGKENNTND